MQEEIFGPVTCVTVFDTEAEVVERVNNTRCVYILAPWSPFITQCARYGLCASVWSQNVGTIHRVAQQLEVGTVWSNCWLIRS